jgi:hypothetical protein
MSSKDQVRIIFQSESRDDDDDDDGDFLYGVIAFEATYLFVCS